MDITNYDIVIVMPDDYGYIQEGRRKTPLNKPTNVTVLKIPTRCQVNSEVLEKYNMDDMVWKGVSGNFAYLNSIRYMGMPAHMGESNYLLRNDEVSSNFGWSSKFLDHLVPEVYDSILPAALRNELFDRGKDKTKLKKGEKTQVANFLRTLDDGIKIAQDFEKRRDEQDMQYAKHEDRYARHARHEEARQAKYNSRNYKAKGYPFNKENGMDMCINVADHQCEKNRTQHWIIMESLQRNMEASGHMYGLDLPESIWILSDIIRDISADLPDANILVLLTGVSNIYKVKKARKCIKKAKVNEPIHNRLMEQRARSEDFFREARDWNRRLADPAPEIERLGYISSEIPRNVKVTGTGLGIRLFKSLLF